MTESGPNDQRPSGGDQTEPTTGPKSAPPATTGAWVSAQPRAEVLAAWIAEQSGAHTSLALERSAIESGYTKAEFDEAVRLAGKAEREQQVIKPLKVRARLMVLIGYALVWMFFGIQYLVLPAPGTYVDGSGLQTILTISLLVTIGISLIWIYGVRPDPDRAGRALAILLAVPLVLLIGVAGLCLPFLPVR